MRSPTMEACLREQMGRATEAAFRWKERYERCASRCKAAITKLRANFAEAEEACLNTLTDEVGSREEMILELHGQLSCLCAAIEIHPIEQESDFLKVERERARKLLERYDVTAMTNRALDQQVHAHGMGQESTRGLFVAWLIDEGADDLVSKLEQNGGWPPTTPSPVDNGAPR